MSVLNTEIKIGAGQKLPSKKSINLLVEEKHTKQNIIAIVMFCGYLVLLYFFTKYAVIGQLDKINQLESSYAQMNSQVETITAQNKSYSTLQAEYAHYGNGYMTDEEKAAQDRMDILKVIEDNLLNQDALQTIDITGNVATLTINSEKLANVSDIVARLEEEDIVSYITVATAEGSQTAAATQEALEEGESAADAAKNVTTTMTIYFKDANAEEDSDSSDETASDGTSEEAADVSTESTEAGTESTAEVGTEAAESAGGQSTEETAESAETTETATAEAAEAADGNTAADSSAADGAASSDDGSSAESGTETAQESADSTAAESSGEGS